MNKNKVRLIAAVVGVAVAAVDIVKVTKSERQKREQIKIQTEIEIKRINDARDKVIEKMSTGEYGHSGIMQLMSDLEFEYIIGDIDGRY